MDGIIRYFGKGFNFSQDGPGNRLVYHLYGCNFRCPWCSNPECFSKNAKVQEQTTDGVISEIIRSRAMFFSGGGVTFTGGEPTLQIDPLKTVLEAVREQGVHTAIESNGSNRRLSELFSLTDFLMMDLKHTDDAVHKRITGASCKATIENIAAAAESRQLALRIPLIEGYNTDSASIEGFINFLISLKRREDFTVELLPYHEYGKVKWDKQGLAYTVKDGFVPADKLAEISECFAGAGIKLIKT